MTPDDIELLAYVDGKLPAPERAALERLLAASPDAALRVKRLETSKLPYADAFAHQRLPPVPPSLARMIDGIAQAARLDTPGPAHSGRGAGANDDSNIGARGWHATARVRAAAAGWLAAAFFAGALACGFALRFGYDDARLVPHQEGAQASAQASAHASAHASTDPAAAPWVEAAAHYQQLYSRETLANVDADAALSQTTLDKIRQEDRLDIHIPDLRAYGLTFKRVQRLQFHGRPLVQIVYLPAQGNPVALCLMHEAQADAMPADRTVASMAVVTWRRAHIGYALIGASGDAALNRLARSLAQGDAASLFGAVAPPLALADGMRTLVASSG
ncbi:anti-sigma factor [Caballeronia sp. SL2Y3]|uniref:anti-sigma factor family protein n=1 Tax=Caballeronia sp. SL2Y3 TaxID=2878151 RepID=UPI001FD1A86E|nr:anti-sigma factor [Caballeronia sp. SL2Y3]